MCISIYLVKDTKPVIAVLQDKPFCISNSWVDLYFTDEGYLLFEVNICIPNMFSFFLAIWN